MGLAYFTQILDIDTACSNALRDLRNNSQATQDWFTKLSEDQWMFKGSVPISVKY
jgi:hypothetical protein